jgi:hypothetical protein
METIKTTYAGSNFSAEHNPINSDLLIICRSMIKTSREARGMISEPKADELDRTVKTWASELRMYSIAEIKRMFDRAMRDYVDTSLPFGVPQLKAAALTLTMERRQMPKTVAPLRCERHVLVEIEREANDPPLILNWRVCGVCQKAFPKFARLAPPALRLVEVQNS